MFRPTNRQNSLLEASYLLPKAKADRLSKSWAHIFRTCVMPLIDEEAFRDAFCANNGRPNFSIRLLAGAHLLKEWNDLTDQQVIDQVEFNLQWQYALNVTPEDAHLVQRTMHSFRCKLMEQDRARTMFEDVTRKLAEADGLSFGRQRLDSTHLLSNIAVLTRLGLFVETVSNFLRELRKLFPDRLEGLDARFPRRYLDREGYFCDAKREQARRRLPVVAADIYDLVHTFEADKQVQELPSFALLQRLFAEQCEVVSTDDDPDADRGDDSETGDSETGDSETGDSETGDSETGDSETATRQPKVKVREPKTVSSSSLQSPYDPDATYGHKGKGYEAQLVETCDDDNPYQVITAADVNGAHESDQAALVPLLDRLAHSGMAPDELLADTGYGSGSNIVASAERGVDLQAPVQDPKAPKAVDPFLQAGVHHGCPSPDDAPASVDGPAVHSSQDDTSIPSATPPIAEGSATPPVDEDSATPPVDEHAAVSSVAEPGVTPPIAEPGVTPPIAEPGVTPPIAEPDAVTPIAEPDAVAPIDEADSAPSVAEPCETSPIAEPGAAAPIDEPAVMPSVDEGSATLPIDDDFVRAALSEGFDLASFVFSATFQHVFACPNEQAPAEQHVAGAVLVATFSAEHCRGCPLSWACPTRELKTGDRQLRRAPSTIATETRQYEQQTDKFKDRYRKRSGIESTNSTLKGPHGLADLRVRGKPRVKLAVFMKSLALNTKRAVQYHVARLADRAEPSPA